MKNKIKLSATIIALVIIGLSACKKIENQYPSTTVKVSYPTITLKGDSIVSIAVGSTYTDAGATLTDDITGAQSDITALDADQVDPSTPGLYMVSYQASNSNGFKTIKQRPVLVSDIPSSWDLTGVYQRTANGVNVNVTKVANGLYVVDNVGGVASSAPQYIFPVYMGQLDDSTLDIPAQYVADGSILDCLEETLTIATPDTSFSYIVDNPSFGTATRTFVKQ